ncbi:MAG TPA: DUF1015 domain-containing protein [Dehalococcoidales bacterium]|nr:MAG: hypothetical protein A2Z05_01140 [Chloroflexi bacterium RBG_16_60_22]HJX12274.1 DUF1015 domain-containing protein [Dehalococcoidales bacterium]
MADIRPFRGTHYNPSLVKGLAKVICPPYDVITPQLQEELYRRSDCNFVRVEYGRELPQDSEADNKYTRAAAAMEKWLEQGVIETDGPSSFYIHDHHFTHQGKECRRRGLAGLVRLEEWSKMIIRPHEGTLARPRSDRLSLLWAIQANTSPIMALYEDRNQEISTALEAASSGKPVLEVAMENGEGHRLWAVTDKKTIGRITRSLADQPLYIADGHHRYESALAYQRERRTCSAPESDEEPFDYVMMHLVDFADPGLVILPAHRLVRGVSPPALAGLRRALNTCFHVREVPLDGSDTDRQFQELLSADHGEVKLLLLGLTGERLLLLTLNDFSIVRPMMPYFHSDVYQRLDVSIVDHVIMEELLGLTHDKAGTFLDYTSDARDAVSRVREKEYQLALVVNPVKPEVVKAIADSGDRMPRKSTYFYPKLPAGLVLYRFG